MLHVPSKTLIAADLVFNMPPKEQYSAPGAPNPRGPLGLLGSFLNVGPFHPRHQTIAWNALAKDRAYVRIIPQMTRAPS